MYKKRNASQKLFSYLAQKKNIILTLDVFDTLLLRNTKSETQRFREVANIHENLFNKKGLDISRDCLFCARLIAHKTGYKTAPLVEKCRDASIDHIFDLYLKLLGLPGSKDMIEQLITIELEYEKKNLRLNRKIYELACQFQKKGGRVLLISDMYLKKKHLYELLNYFCGYIFYSDIFVSSEFSASKFCGILYDILLDTQKLKAWQVVHVGDNFISDYLSPQSKGIHAFYIPRSLIFKLIASYRQRVAKVSERFFLQ